MSTPANPLLDRYLRHQRIWEVALWTMWWLLDAAANSVVVLMDYERSELPVDWWRPVIWEYSSALMLLVLLLAQLAFDRRFPFQPATWRRALAAHALATIP